MMNKTEHVDYFLDNNLSVREIKLSQIYSAISALEKVMTDIHLPKILGQVGNIYRLVYRINDGDSEIRITDSLKNAQEPTVIYSSGVNNLMRAIGTNPFSVQSDYKNRNIKPNYDYTVKKINDERTLNDVMMGIRNNFEHLLQVNDKMDIYTLGAYVPKALQVEEMNILRDMVIEYNALLASLCKKYGITFIDTDTVGRKYNKSKANFHINATGYNMIANHILELMYNNKIKETRGKTSQPIDGSLGVFLDLERDIAKAQFDMFALSGYDQTRQGEIVEEHQREQAIFKKVLSKK